MEGSRRNKRCLKNLLLQQIPKVVFLQEIWIPYHDGRILNDFLPDYSFSIATPDMFLNNEDKLMLKGPVWHGCAIGWHKDINSDVTAIESNHERLVGIRYKMNSTSILLVSLYAPTSGQDEDFMETISHLSSFIDLNTASTDNIIIGTDSNCSTRSTARRQDAWRTFLSTFSLMVHNTPDPTFHHNNGSSESTIDYFVTSAGLAIEKLTQFCTLENPLNLSGHDPILTNLVIKDTQERQPSKFAESYTDFKLEKIIWKDSEIPKYQTLAAQALKDASTYWDTPESTPLLVSMFSSLLVNCAKSVFRTKTRNNTGVQKSSKILQQAEHQLSNSFKAWKRAGKPLMKSDRSRIAYTSARSNLQWLQRHQDNLKSIRDNNFLMFSERHDRSKVFSRLKKL